MCQRNLCQFVPTKFLWLSADHESSYRKGAIPTFKKFERLPRHIQLTKIQISVRCPSHQGPHKSCSPVCPGGGGGKAIWKWGSSSACTRAEVHPRMKSEYTLTKRYRMALERKMREEIIFRSRNYTPCGLSLDQGGEEIIPSSAKGQGC